jgi:hypothetical protein
VYKTGKPSGEIALKLLLRLILVAAAGLVALVWSCWTWVEVRLGPHRSTIENVFDGHVDPAAQGKYRFDCGRFKCETFLPQLPRATRVACTRLNNSGACCLAYFGDQYRSEIHTFRQADGSYIIQPTIPYCRNPNFDKSARLGSALRQRFIPCYEHWGIEAPPGVAKWPS